MGGHVASDRHTFGCDAFKSTHVFLPDVIAKIIDIRAAALAPFSSADQSDPLPAYFGVLYQNMK